MIAVSGNAVLTHWHFKRCPAPSREDPQWKNDLLGFGDPGDTIGYVGCPLTRVAMLLSGHGYSETPKTLNEKLKGVGGFVSSAIAWGAVSKIYPNVSLKAFIPCSTSDAPLAQIDAAIAAGQPAVVQVDSSPAAGIQTHWVVLYASKGDDYLMLDPWPYSPGTDKEDYLMKRYAQGRTLQRAISHRHPVRSLRIRRTDHAPLPTVDEHHASFHADTCSHNPRRTLRPRPWRCDLGTQHPLEC